MLHGQLQIFLTVGRSSLFDEAFMFRLIDELVEGQSGFGIELRRPRHSGVDFGWSGGIEFEIFEGGDVLKKRRHHSLSRVPV